MHILVLEELLETRNSRTKYVIKMKLRAKTKLRKINENMQKCKNNSGFIRFTELRVLTTTHFRERLQNLLVSLLVTFEFS